jgi:toxin CcdB
MNQFDVFLNPTASRKERPFFVIVQHQHFLDLPRIAVVPLVLTSAFRHPLSRLRPSVMVDGQSLFLMTEELTNIPPRLCQHPVANLAAEREVMIGALDLLFTGV